MGNFSYPRPKPLVLPSHTSLLLSKFSIQLGIFTPNRDQFPVLQFTSLSATLNTPKGFGPAPKKSKKTKKPKKDYDEDEDEDDDEDDDEDEDEEENREEAGVIPEIVTNRMMSRMAFSVGIPMFTGVLFFPLFYYLKAGLKIDVPTWIPFMVSSMCFGTALLGVSYGIVSSSWDPMRKGSLLGWNEAQKNWPVFWQSIWGGGSKK